MPRPNRHLPRVDPMTFEGLFERIPAAADVEQGRTDAPIRPRIDRLL